MFHSYDCFNKIWLSTSHISISKNFSYLIDWFFWITSARVERETGSGQQDLFVAAPLTEHVCFRDELQKNLLASDDSCKQRSAKRKADETSRCSRFRTRTYIRVRRECMHCSSKSGRQTFEGSKIGFWGSRENELRLHLLLYVAAASAAVWRKDFQEQSCEASRNVMWYLSKFHDFPPPCSIFSGKFFIRGNH